MKMRFLLTTTLIAGIMLTISSCKTPKATIGKATGATELNIPFLESKYNSDKDFFRAHQSGKCIDLACSKMVAMQNAKGDLASNINAIVKIVSDGYTNNRTVLNKADYENKFELLNRQATEQILTDVNIIGERVFQEIDGSYTYYVAIEKSKQSILDVITTKISKNDKLQLDFDKKKYEEIFNSEMEKMSKGQ